MTVVRVLYEDEHLLLVVKPKLALTCPFFEISLSLLSWLLCKHLFSISLVHRLDYGTYGVIVVCKTAAARACFARQFYDSDVIKKYVCLSAQTAPSNYNLNVCSFLNIVVFSVGFLRFCLLDCKLFVGKRHSIRLAQRHICGDKTYCIVVQIHGLFACLISSLRYQCLNACLICFRHVASAKLLTFEYVLQPLLRYLLINFLKLSALRF
ncbi:pseudouridine synthase [Candidatus Hodgkinia cicadicola]